MTQTLREKCEQRLLSLKRLREDYDPECLEVARFMQPHRSRFLTSDRGAAGNRNQTNRGVRRHWNNKLADSYGLKAARTLTHGMTSGLTSASRPWFVLGFEDQDIKDRPGVRDWLSEVEKRMYAFLARTNFYGAAKIGYAENGLFGTEACLMMEHRTRGMVCHNFTFGEYWIACGDHREPDVLYRACPLTVREAVQTFGNAVSQTIRGLYDRSQYTDIVNFFQAIEPNSDFAGEFGQQPWRSVYWDADDTKTKTLSVRGFMDQPFWAARWDVASGETYGTSPGMEALPAVRKLQLIARREDQMLDKVVKPEMVAPTGVRLTGQAGRIVSGSGFTKENFVIPNPVDYRADQMAARQREHTEREIDALTYAELFNAITNMQGIQPRTVEEIAARNEEKLTQLGPVIERVSNEKLRPIIERTYGIMLRGGMLPPAPEEIAEREIKIEFVSILTQMQRMVGIGSLERTSAFIGNLAGIKPDALDKLDTDELIDDYAERAGAPARIIRSAKEVEGDRKARQQAQQMAQMAEMAPAMRDGAEAARLLSEADANIGRGELPTALPV
jgi:hypothetical protein